MAEPIWKDYIVDLGAPSQQGAGVAFVIYSVDQSSTIFKGVAYPRPGETNAFVRINDICADYISSRFLEEPSLTMPAKPTFRVLVNTVQKASVQFYGDWSYDPYYDPATMGQNFPVILTFAAGQYIPVTLWSGSIGTATIYTADGNQYSCTPVQSRGGDFNDDYNDDFLRTTQYFGDTYVIPLSDYPGAVKVVYNGRTWLLSGSCPQYVIYYLNAHGGWDALPVEGKAVRSDALTRYTKEIVYDNRQSSARGLDNYVNELKPQLDLWTGWLTTDQSERMHHLLNSPKVFVQDTGNRIVYPVVLTGSTTEYKNQHGILHAYRIRAELAQNRIRR